MPPVGGESFSGVVAKRQLGDAVDGDVIVVVEDRQSVEAERAGERRRFVADPFFKTAIAREDPGAMVDEAFAVVTAQDLLGDSHADAVGDTLSEWSGRDFDGRGHAAFGVARGLRVDLAKLFEVLNAQVVAELVGERVLQDATVPVTQDEPVSIAPLRISRVVAHDSRPEHHAEGREGHRGAAVARVGFGGCVHGDRDNLTNHSSF